jgi:hypothetical protein
VTPTILFCFLLSSSSRLRGGKAERFFADDVQPGFQRRFGDGEVGIVRRGDRYDFNTVRAQRLFAEQRLIIGVAALRRDPELFTELTSALGIDIKRAGQQGKDIVTQRRTSGGCSRSGWWLRRRPCPSAGSGIRVSCRLTWCSP